MEKISEMIKRLCPEGVEYVKLGEVAEIGTGSGNRQDAIDDGGYPFFVRSKEVLRSNTYEFDEEAILIPGEGGIGDIFHYYNGKYALHQRTYRIHVMDDKLCTKYLFYYLFANFKAYILRKAVASTATSIRKPMIENYAIPLPPLPIQQEIVRILDSFTSMITNLETELVSRQKQYEYFREELLKFDKDECVWRLISDFSSVLRGKRLTRNMLSDSNTYPVYHGGNEPIGYYTEYNRPACTVMVINVGASAGTVGFCDKDFWSSDGCFCLKKNEGVNDKFLYHSLKVRENEIMTKVRTAGIPTLDNKVVENIVLPIPTLERQREIVSTLDTFESLIENIKREIEARKKQYEYYREQLLTFE